MHSSPYDAGPLIAKNGSAEPLCGLLYLSGECHTPWLVFVVFSTETEPSMTTTTDLLTTDAHALDELPMERLETEISSFAGRLASATAMWLCWIAAYDRRRGWEGWQAKSCSHWLNWRCGVSMRTAREHVRVARALDEFEVIRRTFLAGEISYSKVRAITRVVIPENEADLIAIALDGTASQVERLCAGMRRNDREEGDDAKNAIDNQHTKMVNNGDGTATIMITAPVAEAKQAYAAMLAHADGRIADEQMEGTTRAETIERLGGLARIRTETACALLDGTIESTEMPATDLLFVLDVEALDADAPPDAACTLDHERLPPLVAKRLACDARLQLALDDAVGDALGIGRTSRVVPRRIRRAMARRDKNMCRFPGCEATRRLHAHHIVHWLDGGPTELDNLVSLCHFHHQSVHDGGWNVIVDAPGRFRFVDAVGVGHRVPRMDLRASGRVPELQNGSAEPLAASGERADIGFVTDVILGNTELRLARQ